jgi:eukaryotic-like serine/threonine-protein kinase
MAPELLSDKPTSIASDLYAVRVIACELLTGHHPFTLKNVGQLIVGILSAPPDLSGLGGDLFDVVARLLEKQPQDRYENAVAVIHDLCSAIGQPSPIESQAIRESFLQAAKFVGRQAELHKLRAV